MKFQKSVWTGGLFLGAFGILIYYFVAARDLVFAESAAYLNEVSRQMSASIARQCQAQWRLIDLACRSVRDRALRDPARFDTFFTEEKDAWGFDSFCLVDDQSTYLDRDHSFSLLDQDAVTDRLLTRRESVILADVLFEERRQLIFLLPVDDLRIGDRVFKAAGVRYDGADLFDALSISAFGGESDLYIVHRDGTILFRSLCGNGVEGYNLLNSLEAYPFQTGSPERLRRNMAGDDDEMMTVRLDGESCYVNHTPIGVGDWQLVMMVPVDAVSGSMNHFSRLSALSFGLIAVLLVAVILIFYTDFMKRGLRAEERARLAAESANLAKSRFLSSMSHDIRTPMNAIMGMAHIALTHLDKPPKVRDCLRKIERSGRLLVGLINDILDLSKIESGKMALNNASASLPELLLTIADIACPIARENRQDFHIRIHNLDHEQLRFDALRLSQVLINLVSNALKFTPNGGSICLDVSERASTETGKAGFTFRVKDTGFGMRPEFLEHLFDAFTRERDGRVDKTEGSGLGMAITKEIVTMMGGVIEVRSAPGRGTEFTVHLDFETDDAALRPAPASFPVRVLLVDDDPATVRAALPYLARLGVTADAAASGRAAVNQTAEARRSGRPYSLVLFTWELPDMTGPELAAALRRQEGANVPLLVGSACGMPAPEAEMPETGLDGWLAQPLYLSGLGRMLARCLSKADAGEAPDAVGPALSGRRALLVEDNDLNREIGVELLSQLGAVVEVAVNGREGVDAFRQSPPGYYDVILMDVQMPVMNGYDATRAIRQLNRPDAATVPIFAMTADAFAEDIARARMAGMDEHLPKPLDFNAMTRTLRAYLVRDDGRNLPREPAL